MKTPLTTDLDRALDRAGRTSRIAHRALGHARDVRDDARPAATALDHARVARAGARVARAAARIVELVDAIIARGAP